MTLKYSPRPYEELNADEQRTIDDAFHNLATYLRERNLPVYYDDRAENLVDEIVRFTQGKN